MAEIRIHRYRTQYPRKLANGGVKYYTNSSARTYRCKLHHPNSEEMATICAELAVGLTKKEVLERHRIGSYQRLDRLLAKYAAALEAPQPAGAPCAAMRDADVEALLVEAGWA